LADDNRLKYWKQAAMAIGERPWFGSGPGTFYLQSLRLQVSSSSFSWFAHSFPLQSIVELGILGSLLLFVLIGLQIRAAVKIICERVIQVNESHRFVQSLAWGVLLSFLYSFYEFNLDYLVLWLLFWAACGLVIGYREKASP
ncbi:MAG: O-antigen ligase family protein, partial [Patescibacteria group bacterium]